MKGFNKGVTSVLKVFTSLFRSRESDIQEHGGAIPDRDDTEMGRANGEVLLLAMG